MASFHFKVNCFLYFVLLSSYFVYSMTRQQLKNSGKLLKKACIPKTNVSEEQIRDIDKGKFIGEKKIMCYIACIYTMSQAIKNNKIQHDVMIKQVETMFPNDIKESAKFAIQQCRGIAKQHKDICEAAFWTTKCLYDADPATFIFP
uniref:Odorant binding protein n=1 Tax=Chilo suppressalis TaxID=168631 RepID=X2C512_CHISP|nr:odorant binding protein [Chilo suppressalis]